MSILALFLAGCSSQRELSRDLEVSGTHRAGSAFDGDYLVRKGATLHVSYASGSRFYVESGGRLHGFRSGATECTIFAEPGAHVDDHGSVGVVPIKNARKAYADRNRPTPVLPSGIAGTYSSSGSSVTTIGFFHDDDDDRDYFDDDDRRRRDKPKARISKSSYKKKDD